ncbi:Rhodanese-like domain-containing protein [Mortierella sp. GBAus27b]|nr:Rhodanese-like domain-containing protein [Mortierella sp. GBAus27b]
MHQTLTLYTVTPIPEDRLEDLREEIFLQLVQYDITGRVYVAKDGINLHLCTPVEHMEALQSTIQELVLDRYGKGLDGAIWNFSCEEPGERVFERLRVAVKSQLVADGRLGSWSVQDSAPPQYLEPAEFHARLDQVGGKTLLVDMRNHFENEVGRFETSIKMDCTTFRENMDLLDELLEGRDKSEEIMMVCTGGIRCSISGRYLKQKGYKDVKMLKGGITSYGRWIRSNPEVKSHFVGKNFTFDGRRGERITQDVISTCHQCHSPHDHITNCANTRCHVLFIQCPNCRQKWSNTCGPECQEAVERKTGPGLSKPYDYHAQVRPGRLLVPGSEVA